MFLTRTGYKKEDIDIVASIWSKTDGKSMNCPQCGKKMVLIQVEPIQDAENAYVPYDTVIECTSCSFRIKAESFTILGSVKDFNAEHVEIGSWSPSGSRVLSYYEHILDHDTLKKLKETGELVEFLIVNKQVVQVIG
jgi:DNA-directed RNA polymerase subunit RPC12/RpoP